MELSAGDRIWTEVGPRPVSAVCESIAPIVTDGVSGTTGICIGVAIFVGTGVTVGTGVDVDIGVLVGTRAGVGLLVVLTGAGVGS